jgi:uncharacterized protein GlcG (DUF336 family)
MVSTAAMNPQPPLQRYSGVLDAMKNIFDSLLVLLFTIGIVGCGSGTRDDGNTANLPPGGCSGSCVSSVSFLTSADVTQVINAAIAEAQSRNAAATIAVVDRVGNVLAVYQMNGANSAVTIRSPYAITGGLEQLDFIPATAAAISKAITGAYLSSEGNAFSTRTAGQIIQQNFNVGEVNQPAGPLFGVQFSQLACSDLSLTDSDGQLGPKRSPLGLSADPGGFPLYKAGVLVGGVGVLADGLYSFDEVISDLDNDLDEAIALAASRDFIAPADRQASRITVDGKTLRFSDLSLEDLVTTTASSTLINTAGSLISVNGYFDALNGIQMGTVFSEAASGIRAETTLFPGQDAFVLVDNIDTNRYPPSASTATNGLTQADTTAILNQALTIANKARSQIRRPLNSQARVSIAVVDADGVVLGIVRSRDAPVFGTDVALQKARTAAFYSNPNAASDIQTAATVNYLSPSLTAGVPTILSSINLNDYVNAVRVFLSLPDALNDGAIAFSDRAGGNLSRPFYPDGIEGNNPGPFSKPGGQWSPFSTGIQLDLVYNQLVAHVAFVAGLSVVDVAPGCSGMQRVTNAGNVDPIANGIQIFPGSVPIYRNGVLIGGFGVSGDGVDQDDMIAFLGVHFAAEQTASLNNAPTAMRADILSPQGVRLRFIQCPQAPFLDSNEDNVCDAK